MNGNILRWVRIYLGVLFHPVEAFKQLKQYRENLSYLLVVIGLTAVIVVRVLYIYLVHFPMGTLKPENTNIFLEIVKYIVPVVSWGIVTFAITSIREGECFLKECMAVASISMVPYVILAIPVALFSKILEIDQKGFYDFMNFFIFAWVALLLFIGLMTTNNYSFNQSLGIAAICAGGVILLWAVFLLIATLTYQFYDFIAGLLLEFRLRTGS